MTGEQLITVGRIGRPRGVRGESFVEPWTDDPGERFAVGSVLSTDPAEAGPLTVAEMSLAGGRLVVRFESVEGRERADQLRGVRLLIDPAQRPVLDDPDEFYDSDLVGLRAATLDGTELGPVRDVLHAGGADYLLLDVAGHERLVPFVRAIVRHVDVAAGTVRIDAPEGLFEL